MDLRSKIMTPVVIIFILDILGSCFQREDVGWIVHLLYDAPNQHKSGMTACQRLCKELLMLKCEFKCMEFAWLRTATPSPARKEFDRSWFQPTAGVWKAVTKPWLKSMQTHAKPQVLYKLLKKWCASTRVLLYHHQLWFATKSLNLEQLEQAMELQQG